jgi:2-methylfumaryl-CoA hydratase
VPTDQLVAHARLRSAEALIDWCDATGASDLWEGFNPGDRIEHPSGMTIEEADHMSATRLHQHHPAVVLDLAYTGLMPRRQPQMGAR